MDDPVDHALQAAVKALAEVVSPAVDPADALAVDQLRLVISWLQFHGQRRPDERRLAWGTLRLRLALARDAQAVLDKAAPPQAAAARSALAERCVAADGLLRRTDAPAAAWRDAAEALDACVCQAIDALSGGPAEVRDALADVVLASAKDSLMLYRSWFAPFGFEARPEALPPLETLLEGAP